VLHGGDSDSTGTIVGAWYGALYGSKDVSENNTKHSEGREYIEELGRKIFERVYK
jgi:ADP-ribosylglycohydrolase